MPPDERPRLLVADVALDPRSGGRDALFTYRAEPRMAVGDAVLVAVGRREVMGVIVDLRTVRPEDLGFKPELLKDVAGVVEGLHIPLPVVEAARRIAETALCSLPVALSPALPPGARERLVPVWTVLEGAEIPEGLRPAERETLRALNDGGGSRELKSPDPAATKALNALRARGLVRQTLRLRLPAERKKRGDLWTLTTEAGRVEAFLRGEGRRKPAQAVALMALQGEARAALALGEIRALAGVTETTVKALVEAGLVVAVEPTERRAAEAAPEPNDAQRVAIDAIVDAVRAPRPHGFLLYGVTGSGKTEVFLRAASAALALGRGVLYLVPEIALATQAIAQLRARFGDRVAVLHSELSPGERLATWIRIRSGGAAVVVGPRSALFAPLTDLGLIVLDEEHEGGYKQDSAPRYHAREIARFLAGRHRCPIVLGSATPSVESFREASENEDGDRPDRLTLLVLPRRVAKATLPAVFIEDLADGYRMGQPSILGPLLHRKLGETLARGEQTILFLNRRAYAPFVVCRDCGHRWSCPRCAVTLSYHRREARMRCHHCGHNERIPETCPQCQGDRLKPFGIGTEKVEETVREGFPGVRLARLDRDVVARTGALEEILAAFRAGDLDVLVGTQLVAKGLDFPNVTLVGVVAADISLNVPDFRAGERTFQLLSQVAGRAGRGSRPGEVVIQTFNPDHIAIQCARDHDFAGFYGVAIEERALAGYPPFRRLMRLLITGEDRRAVVAAAASARAHLDGLAGDGFSGLTVLGPADCPLERIQNRWRRHLLVKTPPEAPVPRLDLVARAVESAGLIVTVDVDPYSMM